MGKEEFEKIEQSGICPFCKEVNSMVYQEGTKDALYCGNCDRVVAYCEGIGVYEETDECPE